MQKAPSQVASGNNAPAITGPDKDLKDVYVMAGLVLVLALVIGLFWFYSQPDQMPSAGLQPAGLTGSEVSDVLKRTTAAPSGGDVVKGQEPAVPQPKSDVFHADVYFEVGRRGLTDEAKAILAGQADLIKSSPDYGVLVQGYTDQQGSANYNKKLGLQRAEKVKEHLIGLGVAEHQIKVVSLGKEGVLCIDTSDVCRHMNRRVHLEVRKIGAEHMTLPPVTTSTVTDPSEAGIDPSVKAEGAGSIDKTLLPSPSDPGTTPLEPTPGS